MYLTRIGATGAGRRVARIDDETRVDRSGAVDPRVRLRPGDVVELGRTGRGRRRPAVPGPR